MTQSPIAPVRYEQMDFFIPNMLTSQPFKDDMATMEYPFFTLSTKPDHRELIFSSGDTEIKVTPSVKGLPTIFDKDILLYCSALFMEYLNRGEIPPRTMKTSVQEILKATNRAINGQSYKAIKNSLIRLKSCNIETNIRVKGKNKVKGVSFIDSYEYVESTRTEIKRNVALKITYSEWFYDALISRQMLTIHNDYFRLRKSIDRRLYELARKHCGEQKKWSISLEQLKLKTGCQDIIRKLRQSVRLIEKTQHLPEYDIELGKDDIVTFIRVNFKPKKIFEDRNNSESYKAKDESGIPVELSKSLYTDAKRECKKATGGSIPDLYVTWDEFRAYNKDKKLKTFRGAFIGFSTRKAITLFGENPNQKLAYSSENGAALESIYELPNKIDEDFIKGSEALIKKETSGLFTVPISDIYKEFLHFNKDNKFIDKNSAVKSFDIFAYRNVKQNKRLYQEMYKQKRLLEQHGGTLFDHLEDS